MKNIIITILLTLVVGTGIVFTGFNDREVNEINSVYKVYLEGQSIGLISDEEALYDLINKEQVDIKNKYEVDQVYPPNGFEIVEYKTYEEQIVEPVEVYNQIKEEKDFTVKGYEITITYPEEDAKEPLKIYLLDNKLFDEAMNKLVTTFIEAKKFNDYLNDTQSEIIDVGSIIESMSWEETINIKEAYIDSEEKIYTDEDELAQYILFGNNNERATYTVEEGDTIQSVANDQKLNVQEFLVANPQFNSENDLLAIGDTVVIALIDPIVSLVYDMEVVEDVETEFESETKTDNTQYSSYRKVEQEGQKGVMRVTKKTRFVNGVEQQGTIITDHAVLKEPVTEIVTVGGYGGGYSYLPSSGVNGSYVDNGLQWGWPTNTPYTLSSPYGWRWGMLHDGIDISGTGYGSPIYAALGGTVMEAGFVGGGTMYYGSGIAVIVDHHNGYYTVYAHLSEAKVTVGQKVERRQVIGAMGNTGTVTPRPTSSSPYSGTHLHFGVFRGYPYQGGVSFDPMQLYS